MNDIEKLLSEKFGKDDIKISFTNEKFDLEQTGQDFFSLKKDVQFFVLSGRGIKPVAFNQKTKRSLSYQIALDYTEGYFGSLIPTQLICVTGARNTRKRNADGTFNGVIYSLDQNQIEQIKREYNEIEPFSY